MFLRELAMRGRAGDLEALIGFWFFIAVVCLLVLVICLSLFNEEYRTFATKEELAEWRTVGFCDTLVRMLPNGTIVYNSWAGNLTCVKIKEGMGLDNVS